MTAAGTKSGTMAVMSARAFPVESGDFHAVRFFKDAEGLCRIVGGFLTEGFRCGQPAVVIATPQHAAALAERLAQLGVDVGSVTRSGALTMVDAAALLDTFMVDGMPDSSRFRTAVSPYIERATANCPGTVVRAYGEMVDVLWKDGQSAAAMRLETLWNALANSHRFALLCGYALGNFYKSAAVNEICSHHSHVLTESGEAISTP
jgi:hypothetical protein